MSQSPLNTMPVPAPGTSATSQPLRPSGDNPPAATQEQVLSWEAALGRAEHSAARPGGAPGGSPNATDAAGQEWSPMNPHGTPPAGGEAEAMAGARDATTARAPMQTATESGAQARAMPGEGADLPTHMSPEELLQRQWDRVAMGLEPDASPGGEVFDEATGEWTGGAESQAGACMAQPVTWTQPMAVGWQALPVNERPVADGMTTEELVSERHVESERADDQAYEAKGEVAAEQARLTEVNTPDTLPERTIESV